MISPLLTLKEDYGTMMGETFKYVVLWIIFHFITYLTGIKDYGIAGPLFNEKFLVFLLLLAITFFAYYLIVVEAINIYEG